MAWDVPELHLRSYRPSDLPALFNLDLICFQEPFRFTRQAMRRFAEAPNAVVLIADIGLRVAGFIIVHVSSLEPGNVGYITTLDVHPDFRLQGVAAELIKQAERLACERGCTAMQLHVFAENHTAIRVYECFGYKRLCVNEHFYGEGLNAVRYGKALAC